MRDAGRFGGTDDSSTPPAGTGGPDGPGDAGGIGSPCGSPIGGFSYGMYGIRNCR